MQYLISLSILIISAFLTSFCALAFESAGVGNKVPMKTDPLTNDVANTGHTQLRSAKVVKGSVSNKTNNSDMDLPNLSNSMALPNLDFGMEFLYTNKGDTTEKTNLDYDASLQIRGTIKHRF
ncbi:MAG: hypothetical protein TECD_00756 [Hyphomicrobiaceae bacterium hypho_1]